ncbi:helix-turn-helix domain-containing protein [Shouchella patagoniensis]|uniref:helix-turn-helix domain-containing protein n=1 Tax=Shouchella patagoniensis TaxID=228576 RepID=UPI000994D1E9|nr:helix-turn-helix domain-containing protein [Shouchella patagoniensis]
MSELGNYLKEVREEKQMTLEDLQRTTKIQKRYLAAIEEGNFDTLPGIFYARAFVKTYAEAVGLDADEVVATYKNELPNPQNDAVDLPSRSERTKPVHREQKPSSGRRRSVSSILIPLLIIAAVVIAVVVVWNVVNGGSADQEEVQDPPNNTYDPPAAVEDEENDEQDTVDEENDNGTEEDNAATDEDTEEDNNNEPELTLEDESANSQSFLLSNVDSLESIVITMSGQSYIGVRDGNNVSELLEDNSADYGADYEPDVDGLESVNVRIGNGFDVERFEVNGVEVKLLETDVQTVQIDVVD